MTDFVGPIDIDALDDVQPMTDGAQKEYLTWLRGYFSGLTGGQMLDSFLLGVVNSAHRRGYNDRIDDENYFNSQEETDD